MEEDREEVSACRMPGTCKHRSVVAHHSFVRTDSRADCSVAQYVPNRFILTVNIVNV